MNHLVLNLVLVYENNTINWLLSIVRLIQQRLESKWLSQKVKTREKFF